MGWRDLEVLLVHSSFRNLTSLSNIPQSGHLVTSELSQCWGACPLPLLREPTPLLDCSDNQKFPSQWTGLHLLGLSLTLSTHSHGPVENPPDDSGDIGDVGSIPGLERSSRGGHSNPPQYSCLENPMDRGGWRATVHGVPKSRTRLKWRARTHACIFSPIYILSHLPAQFLEAQNQSPSFWMPLVIASNVQNMSQALKCLLGKKYLKPKSLLFSHFTRGPSRS